MTRRALLALAACAVVLAASAVLADRVGQGAPKEVMVGGSYAVGYDSLEQLKTDSSAVVLGKIGAVARVDKDFPPQLGSTYFLFDVTQPVRPKGVTLPQQITVRQYRYADGRTTRELHEDPVMKVGEEYVLFLKLSDDKQFYWITGGPQGRFAVRNGKVYPLVRLLRPSFDFGVDGQPVEDFVQKVNQG